MNATHFPLNLNSFHTKHFSNNRCALANQLNEWVNECAGYSYGIYRINNNNSFNMNNRFLERTITFSILISCTHIRIHIVRFLTKSFIAQLFIIRSFLAETKEDEMKKERNKIKWKRVHFALHEKSACKGNWREKKTVL